MKKFILSLFAAFFCMNLSAQVSLSDLVSADTESAIAKYLKAKAVSTGEAGVDNFCAAVRTAATASQQSNVSIKALYEKLSAGGAGTEEANSVLEGLKTQVTSLVAAGKNAPAALAAHQEPDESGASREGCHFSHQPAQHADHPNSVTGEGHDPSCRFAERRQEHQVSFPLIFKYP